MNSTEALALLRQEVFDNETPYLLSDATLYAYLDDAQKMFCRLTHGIEDTRTVELTRLAIEAGTDWYDLSPLVLKVAKAVRVDNGKPLDLVTAEMAEKQGRRFGATITGVPQALVTGMSKNAVRVWPMPSEAVDVEMTVFRLPLVTITDEGDQEFEVDEQHHQHLLLWAKYRFFDNHDLEIFDPKRSVDYENRFRNYCAKAKNEQERYRRPVGTVAYGGL